MTRTTWRRLTTREEVCHLVPVSHCPQAGQTRACPRQEVQGHLQQPCRLCATLVVDMKKYKHMHSSQVWQEVLES